MSNLFSSIPIPAVLLLLFLLISIVIIVVLKWRFSVQEKKRLKPSSAAITEVKKTKSKEKKGIVQTKSSKKHLSKSVAFYIFGVFLWIVLLLPIIIFLNAKPQEPSSTFLTGDIATSIIPPVSEEQCDRITFFDEAGQQITTEEISNSFLPGDKILIGVKPRRSEDANKARVRINSSLWTRDNEIHEKNTEGFFILECLIDLLSDGRPTVCGMPIGKHGKFSVEAEIYDSNEGIWE